jgi:branched-chain amino acid aminotransferase
MNISITPVTSSRLSSVDFDSLGFGQFYSDHMFSMIHENGQWQKQQIVPFAPISMHPANAGMHYGQSVFEGLKAYRGSDGAIRVFRPDMNAKRLEQSCQRLCIPTIEASDFIAALDALVALDADWIPQQRGHALYIRPVVFSDEGHLGVRPSERYRALMMTSPVGSLYDTSKKPISLVTEQSYTRSAPGGIGYAKTAGNYGASLYPAREGQEKGYQQVLWLDGVEHRYVEEVGSMNIFFRFADRIVTPDLHGTILPGITRDSVIQLLKHAGHQVEERRISIDEVLQGAQNGTLREVFGAGTAAIIVPVGAIAYEDRAQSIANGEAGEMTRWLYDQITGIQHGDVQDSFGWCRIIEPATT